MHSHGKWPWRTHGKQPGWLTKKRCIRHVPLQWYSFVHRNLRYSSWSARGCYVRQESQCYKPLVFWIPWWSLWVGQLESALHSIYRARTGVDQWLTRDLHHGKTLRPVMPTSCLLFVSSLWRFVFLLVYSRKRRRIRILLCTVVWRFWAGLLMTI